MDIQVLEVMNQSVKCAVLQLSRKMLIYADSNFKHRTPELVHINFSGLTQSGINLAYNNYKHDLNNIFSPKHSNKINTDIVGRQKYKHGRFWNKTKLKGFFLLMANTAHSL